MDFTFTPEQSQLRELVRGFLAKHAIRSREPGSYDDALWHRFAGELGLTGLAIPSALGGSGATLVEVAIVLEESGRALLALPYLSTVVGAALLPEAELRDVAAGGTVVALALDAADVVATAAADSYWLDGVAEHVMDGDVASVGVVAARLEGTPALFAVSLAEVSRAAASTMDHSRAVATLRFERAPATLVEATAAHAGDLLHLALAVELLGTGAASLEMTLAHLQTRHQFGVTLSTFQALRHRVADLAVALEAATSTTWYAVRAPAEELSIVAPMAKLVAADAAYWVTGEGIQLHGGIGFTWEHDAHRYFKRATVSRLSYGDPVALRRLIAARAGLLGQ